jgi:plastocyanin
VRGCHALLAALCALGTCAAYTRAQAADIKVQVENASGLALSDAVVYATPLTPSTHAMPGKAIIDQINRQFVPRDSVVEAGTSIAFPNSDNIHHSVYSFSPAKVFTLPLYAGKTVSPVLFDKPGVVVLGCNIHDSMVAWVLVVDTPYYARTDASGTATLTNLPPGEYRLRAWHEPMAQEEAGEPLRVDSGQPALRTLRLDVADRQAPGIAQ